MTTVVEVLRLSGPMMHLQTEELFELLRPDPHDDPFALQPSIPMWREVANLYDVVELTNQPMRRSELTKIEQTLSKSGLYVDRERRIAVRSVERLR